MKYIGRRAWGNWGAGLALAGAITIIGYLCVSHYHAQQDALARLEDAHRAGEHALALEIYRGEVDLRLWPDVALHELETVGGAPPDMHLMAGDAYAHLGDVEGARGRYLVALDWSETEYLTWCRLMGGCPTLEEMTYISKIPKESRPAP